MTVLIRAHSNFDAVAAAAASGDPAEIAAAAALRPLYRDDTMSNRTIGEFDFKSTYCNDGAALAVGKTFRNLVAGGGDATVDNATGISYHSNGSGVKDGIRFTGGSGRILLPPSFKLPSTSTDFLVTMWIRLHAALTGSAVRSFGGWAINGGVNAYSFQVRTTELLGVVDASAARSLVPAPALETVYQLAMDYSKNTSTNALSEYEYVNGVQIGIGTGYTDVNGLNQPSAEAYIGQCQSFVNAGMDFTVHRMIIEDMSQSNNRVNPNSIDRRLLAVQGDWNKYGTRFS